MARSIATTAAGSSRNKGVLMLALLFGILSAALMFAFLSSRDSGGSLDDELGAGLGAESVVVVVSDIAQGKEITSADVVLRSVPGQALLPGRQVNIDDVVGKVATAPMFAGEQVIEAKLTTYAGEDTLAFKVPDGMRGISLMVPHEAWIAAGLPQPGDRVDVLGITTLVKIDPLTGQEKPDIVAGVIAQDVQVLAVSQSLVRRVVNLDARGNPVATPAAGEGTEGAANGEDLGPGTFAESIEESDASTYQEAISITLALPPDLAAKVAIIDAMEDNAGQFRIMPRQQGDSAPIQGETLWSLDEVFGAQ